MSNIIADITPFTLLDFPNKISCILWFAGCNMRCPYCYNPEIVLGKGKLTMEDVYSFLKKRIGLLEGVVFSGGECTLHKELPEIMSQIKDLGFDIKIDTNGSNPSMITKLIEKDYLDFVSIDFKATKKTFSLVTGSRYYDELIETLKQMIYHEISFDVRTTVHSDLLQFQDIEEILSILFKIGYRGNFYIQNFVRPLESLGNMEHSNNKIYKDIKAPEGIHLYFRN
jgi:pyruvate formate lyase activating enzyme